MTSSAPGLEQANAFVNIRRLGEAENRQRCGLGIRAQRAHQVSSGRPIAGKVDQQRPAPSGAGDQVQSVGRDLHGVTRGAQALPDPVGLARIGGEQQDRACGHTPLRVGIGVRRRQSSSRVGAILPSVLSAPPGDRVCMVTISSGAIPTGRRTGACAATNSCSSSDRTWPRTASKPPWTASPARSVLPRASSSRSALGAVAGWPTRLASSERGPTTSCCSTRRRRPSTRSSKGLRITEELLRHLVTRVERPAARRPETEMELETVPCRRGGGAAGRVH